MYLFNWTQQATRPKNFVVFGNANDFLRPRKQFWPIASPGTVATKNFYADMPKVLAPMPQTGSTTQFSAIYVPGGMNLWVTIQRAGTARLDTHPIVGAQGGFY